MRDGSSQWRRHLAGDFGTRENAAETAAPQSL